MYQDKLKIFKAFNGALRLYKILEPLLEMPHDWVCKLWSIEWKANQVFGINPHFDLVADGMVMMAREEGEETGLLVAT